MYYIIGISTSVKTVAKENAPVERTSGALSATCLVVARREAFALN